MNSVNLFHWATKDSALSNAVGSSNILGRFLDQYVAHVKVKMISRFCKSLERVSSSTFRARSGFPCLNNSRACARPVFG